MVRLAGFFQQRLGALDIPLRRTDIGVLDMHRADMVVLGRCAMTVHAKAEHHGVVHRDLKCPAHPLVIERSDAVVEAADDGRARGKFTLHQSDGVQLVELVALRLLVRIDFLGFKGADHGRHIRAIVQELDRIEMCVAVPVALAALDPGTLVDFPFDDFERAGADVELRHQIALLRVETAMHDQGRVVSEAGNQRDIGCRELQLDDMIAFRGDRALVGLVGLGIDETAHARGHRVAFDVLLAPAADVEDNVFRGEIVAVGPLDALAEVQRVLGRIVVDLPAFQQPGREGRIAFPAHEVFAGLARDMRIPVERARIFQPGCPDRRGDAQRSALLGSFLRGSRRRRQRAHCKCSGSSDAECHH